MAEFNKDSLGNTLTVALLVCLVCSVFVSSAAVALKPQQKANQLLDKKQNILRAAGMLPEDSLVDAQGRDVDELFASFTVKAVDLETGRYVKDFDTDNYDGIKAAKLADQSRELTSAEDIATIKRRENIALVYLIEGELIEGENKIQTLVIPVRGYGLWGTLFGYLALESDLSTIAGLGFYSQKETPGLGGEVDNPKWKALWPGVVAFDDMGTPAVQLVKVRSNNSRHEVDALSGATLTTRGVENLVRFWTGELGFGPYLNRLRSAS